MEQFLTVDSIECRYDSQPIVKELSFTIAQGEIACLLGPSGCGKTTLLHAIAGFIPICTGKIILERRVLSSPKSLIAPEDRAIGMVFQDYALFPHLTVYDNISFGLHHYRYSRKKQKHIVNSMLEVVKIPGLGKRYPHELSSGQQQRVALARGLAPHPKLLLMDEPFSNLDTPLKRQLYQEVREIIQKERITAIVVTHDKQEAFALSDKTGILIDKGVVQWDTPSNLFQKPRNRQVANFLGRGQSILGRVSKHNQLTTDIGLINAIDVNNGSGSWHEGEKVEIFLAPDELLLHPNEQLVQGTIIKKVFMGLSTLYTLQLASGLQVEASSANGHDFKLGERSGIEIKTNNLVAFKVSSTYTDTKIAPEGKQWT